MLENLWNSFLQKKNDKDSDAEYTTDKILTVPNLLSLTRLVLLPFLLEELIEFKRYCNDGNGWQPIMILGLIMVFTDLIDGFLARQLKQMSVLGKFIDPIVDSLIIDTLALTFVYLGELPMWIFALIFVRDIIVGLMALQMFLQKGEIISIPLVGRVTPLSWFLVFLILIIDVHLNIMYGVLLLASLLSIISTVAYFYEYKEITNQDESRVTDKEGT